MKSKFAPLLAQRAKRHSPCQPEKRRWSLLNSNSGRCGPRSRSSRWRWTTASRRHCWPGAMLKGTHTPRSLRLTERPAKNVSGAGDTTSIPVTPAPAQHFTPAQPLLPSQTAVHPSHAVLAPLREPHHIRDDPPHDSVSRSPSLPTHYTRTSSTSRRLRRTSCAHDCWGSPHGCLRNRP
jgi:hypothetical protein